MGEPRWEVDGNGVMLVGSKRGVHADIHCHAQTLQASNDLAQQVADALNRLPAVTAERDAWKKAALLYRRLAADGVLRLETGLNYAKAQDLYDEALAAEPASSPGTETPETET